MNVRNILLPLAAALLPCGTGVAEVRLWTDVTGRTIGAEFLSANEDEVFLRLKDGTEATVALGRLSNESLEFINHWKQARLDRGVLFEAPLVWEVYRSKDVTGPQAQRAGYYTLDSKNSGGTLLLEFRRYGPAPGIAADRQAVLRLTSPPRPEAGSEGPVSVFVSGKLVGRAGNIAAGSSFDVPLPWAVFGGDANIELTVKCGADNVMICTGKSGHGPRLLGIRRQAP